MCGEARRVRIESASLFDAKVRLFFFGIIEKDFDSRYCRNAGGVKMDTDKDSGVALFGDLDAAGKRDECIGITGHDHMIAELIEIFFYKRRAVCKQIRFSSQ